MMTDERLAEAEEMADRLAGNHLPNQATVIRELVAEVRRLQYFEQKANEANALLFQLTGTPTQPYKWFTEIPGLAVFPPHI